MNPHFSFFFNIPILKSLCLGHLWALCKFPLPHHRQHSVSWGFPKSLQIGLSSWKQAPDSCIPAKSFEKYIESWCFWSLLDCGWRMELCGCSWARSECPLLQWPLSFALPCGYRYLFAKLIASDSIRLDTATNLSLQKSSPYLCRRSASFLD